MTESKIDLDALGKNQLKNVATGEVVEMSSLWATQPLVAIFFRRWGCIFCRLWAKEVSKIAPQLQKNGVRLIGVGVEDIGVQEFSDGKFFDGELFVDVEKKTYKFLSFKRFSMFSVLAALFTSESRAAIAKGRAMKLGGDLRGDGLQNGGALVVGTGGSGVLSYFKQERPAEVLDNATILAALGLQPEPAGDTEEKTKAESPSDGTKVLEGKCEMNGAAGTPEKQQAASAAE
ncbi:prostamide/prostaglandin F synthase-like [Schistocerca serialis cubense]|uniref:prostamide/prostaglandin F synthase-like n=1 Tax=Schistocerca serialis cubense TaxID=2023355 RepID=UPI00214F4BDF|nr:prostamide/prostaglandin F synthase-like [Schistocerca serialis cubense]